jgi:hypothetical protein
MAFSPPQMTLGRDRKNDFSRNGRKTSFLTSVKIKLPISPRSPKRLFKGYQRYYFLTFLKRKIIWIPLIRRCSMVFDVSANYFSVFLPSPKSDLVDDE